MLTTEKIETAVKFLNNPRVRETPLIQRKAFLVKKGLTEDEIQKAFELSQTTEIDSHNVSPRNPVQGQITFPGTTPSYSVRLRDFFLVAFVGGSFGYLIAHFVKTYLLPYILNEKDESDEKIDQLQNSVSELKENLSQTVNNIQDTLGSVQKMLQDQQQKVQTMSLNFSASQASLSQSMTESYSLSEIKSELSSLKGLLLNRRQFPSPVVQSSPFPSIPAWQRNGTKLSEDVDVKPANLACDADGKDDEDKETVECNGRGGSTSSGTLVTNSKVASFVTTDSTGEVSESDHYGNSFSTMSSEVGSPNVSLSDTGVLKESLSDSYVKLKH